MKRLLFIATVVLTFLNLSIKAQSPNFQWAVQSGATSNDEGRAITTDLNGNVYSVGYFSGTVDFDPGIGTYTLSGTGTYNMFISKLDGAGNLLWAKKIAGAGGTSVLGTSIITDVAGDIYITGNYSGFIDFDPGAATSNLSNSAGAMFVLKLTSVGNFGWVKSFGSSSYTSGNSIDIDAVGNLYLTGVFTGTTYFYSAPSLSFTPTGAQDAFVLKLDATGSVTWAKQFGDVGKCVSVDAAGAVYTSGTFAGTADFDPNAGTTNLVSTGSSDVFISKLDASGNFVLAVKLGGTSADNIYSHVLDATGNIYSVGSFNGTADFDPGVGVSNLVSAGSADAFISKLDPSGNFVWASKIGGSLADDEAYSVILDANSNIYTTGVFRGTVDFDPGAGVLNLISSSSSKDAFILKLNSSGNYIWAGKMGGIDEEVGNAITLDGSENIYSIGFFASTTVDFDPNSGTTNLSTFGNYDIYVHKMCQTPNAPSNNTSLANQSACVNKTTTLSVTGTGTVNWYSGSTGGSSLGTGANFVTSSTLTVGSYTYYADVTTCVTSVIRTPITFTVNANPIITVSNGTICSGKVFTMTPSGGVSYTYSSGSNTVSPSSNTTYTVVGSSAQGCTNTAVSNVVVNANPTITVNSGTICSGKVFTISPSGATLYTYSSGSNTVSPTSNTSYTVVGLSVQGCTNTAISNVIVNSLPIITASSTSSLMCTGETTTITANGASSYTWTSNGSGAAIIVSPTTTTNYTVTGVAANSCTNATVFTQSVSVCTGINEVDNVKNVISIFPNPNNGEFTIATTKGIYNIINAIGAVVKIVEIENSTEFIDVKDLSQGVYYIIGKAVKSKIIITK